MRIGTFSARTLERGINLAEYNTPMRQQAQRVSWMVRDRDEAHYIHLRMRVRKADTGVEDGADRMQAFENSLEDSIYAEAAPVPHAFRTEARASVCASECSGGRTIADMKLDASSVLDSPADLYRVATHARGPSGSLPITAEMLLNAPSGNLFGLTQNAGMGWEPARLLDPEFLILSTHGGLRAEDGTPIALGFHSGHWEVGLLVAKRRRAS